MRLLLLKIRRSGASTPKEARTLRRQFRRWRAPKAATPATDRIVDRSFGFPRRGYAESMASAPKATYRADHQCAACAVWAGAPLRQRRAASISASVAPWPRAHISAADAEYLAT